MAREKAERDRNGDRNDEAAKAIVSAKSASEVAAANTARDAKLMAESEARIQRQDMQEKALQRDAAEAVSRAKDAASKFQVTGAGATAGSVAGGAVMGPIGAVIGRWVGNAAEKRMVGKMQRAAGEAAMSSMGMTGKTDNSTASPDVEGSAPGGSRVERVERTTTPGTAPKGALVERDRADKMPTGGMNVVGTRSSAVAMPVRTSGMVAAAPIGSSVASPAGSQQYSAPAPADNTPLLIGAGLLAAKLLFF